MSQQSSQGSQVSDAFGQTTLNETISLMMQNAVTAQQNMQMVMSTSAASCCALIVKLGQQGA